MGKPHAQTTCPVCEEELPDEGLVAYFGKQVIMTHRECADDHAFQSAKAGDSEWTSYRRLTVEKAIDLMFGQEPKPKGTLEDTMETY